jgi:hypothetical protein
VPDPHATTDRAAKMFTVVVFGVIIGSSLTGWLVVTGAASVLFVALVTAFGWCRYA